MRIGFAFSMIVFWLCAAAPAFSADERGEPIDIFILIDRSTQMQDALPDLADWLCTKIIDGIVIPGDRVSIWAVADSMEIVSAENSATPAYKEDTKKRIREIRTSSGRSRLSDALSQLLKNVENRENRLTPAYIVVASNLFIEERGSAVLQNGSNLAVLLKYSKTINRPGWKAVVIGYNLEGIVKTATEDFLESVTFR